MPQTLPDCPSIKRLKLDRDSHFALIGATYGNIFCGIMSIPSAASTGDYVIYAVPYTHASNRPQWKGSDDITKTEYCSTGVFCAGRMVDKNTIYHQEGGIAGHEQLSVHVQKGLGVQFGDVQFLGFSILFSPDKRGFGATSRSQNSFTWGLKDGVLPDAWKNVIVEFLRQKLPEFRGCVGTPITNSARPSARPPPPPPPGPRRK
jgi:hypothetical protein